MSLHRSIAPIDSRRPWWHGTGPYFLILLTTLAIFLAINQTLKNDYKEKLDIQREEIARLQLEAENLQYQKEILEEALLRRIQEVNGLLDKINQMRPDLTVTDEERMLLEKLVTAEARGEDYEGMLAVANVVINRVASESFPSTINGVITQPGQFCPVRTGSIYSMEPDESARKAVADALKGYQVVDGALFFYNPKVVSHGHWIRTRTTITDIGNHRFAL